MGVRVHCLMERSLLSNLVTVPRFIQSVGGLHLAFGELTPITNRILPGSRLLYATYVPRGITCKTVEVLDVDVSGLTPLLSPLYIFTAR
jgi:hypothetical protein